MKKIFILLPDSSSDLDWNQNYLTSLKDDQAKASHGDDQLRTSPGRDELRMSQIQELWSRTVDRATRRLDRWGRDNADSSVAVDKRDNTAHQLFNSNPAERSGPQSLSAVTVTGGVVNNDDDNDDLGHFRLETMTPLSSLPIMFGGGGGRINAKPLPPPKPSNIRLIATAGKKPPLPAKPTKGVRILPPPASLTIPGWSGVLSGEPSTAGALVLRTELPGPASKDLWSSGEPESSSSRQTNGFDAATIIPKLSVINCEGGQQSTVTVPQDLQMTTGEGKLPEVGEGIEQKLFEMSGANTAAQEAASLLQDDRGEEAGNGCPLEVKGNVIRATAKEETVLELKRMAVIEEKEGEDKEEQNREETMIDNEERRRSADPASSVEDNCQTIPEDFLMLSVTKESEERDNHQQSNNSSPAVDDEVDFSSSSSSGLEDSLSSMEKFSVVDVLHPRKSSVGSRKDSGIGLEEFSPTWEEEEAEPEEAAAASRHGPGEPDLSGQPLVETAPPHKPCNPWSWPAPWKSKLPVPASRTRPEASPISSGESSLPPLRRSPDSGRSTPCGRSTTPISGLRPPAIFCSLGPRPFYTSISGSRSLLSLPPVRPGCQAKGTRSCSHNLNNNNHNNNSRVSTMTSSSFNLHRTAVLPPASSNILPGWNGGRSAGLGPTYRSTYGSLSCIDLHGPASLSSSPDLLVWEGCLSSGRSTPSCCRPASGSRIPTRVVPQTPRLPPRRASLPPASSCGGLFWPPAEARNVWQTSSVTEVSQLLV